MNEETLRILKMVEEGKITADKAQELIEALKLLGKIPIDAEMKGMDKIDLNLIAEATDNGL